MKRVIRFAGIALICAILCPSLLSAAGFFGDLLKKELPGLPGAGGLPSALPGSAGLDDGTIAAGLKEALDIGTRKAVGLVSAVNGYNHNDAIRILLPDKIQRAADLVAKLGYQRQVDAFVESMNRAAEKAAPKAADSFAGAIRKMTIGDARKILSGGETSATEYFKTQTRTELYEGFKPTISESMRETGVRRSYDAMTGKIPALSFAMPEAVDLDHYVTTKALDGLFWMVGEEERKIRKDPLARTTDLLTRVFGK